jgi:hypothetical protein
VITELVTGKGLKRDYGFSDGYYISYFDDEVLYFVGMVFLLISFWLMLNIILFFLVVGWLVGKYCFC